MVQVNYLQLRHKPSGGCFVWLHHLCRVSHSVVSHEGGAHAPSRDANKTLSLWMSRASCCSFPHIRRDTSHTMQHTCNSMSPRSTLDTPVGVTPWVFVAGQFYKRGHGTGAFRDTFPPLRCPSSSGHHDCCVFVRC